MKKFIEDFKAFALKGNVFDMAVGMIIGAAFTTIVKSLVDDIIMPLIGILTGGFDLTGLAIKLSEEEGAAQLNYGLFLQNVLNFLIIALVIFIFIRIIGKLHRKKEEAPAEPEPPKKSDEVLLLEDISATLKELAKEKV